MRQGLFVGAIVRLVDLILPTALKSRNYYYNHFTEEEKESWRDFLNLSKPMILILMSFTSLGPLF